MKLLIILLTLFSRIALAQFEPSPLPTATSSKIPDLTCESGSILTYFSLNPIAGLDREKAAAKLKDTIPSSVPLNIFIPDLSNRLRLDTCVTIDGHVNLRRVLRMMEGQIEDLSQSFGSQDWQVNGLEGAVYDQNYNDFQVTISPASYYKHQILGYDANVPFVAVHTVYNLNGRQPDAFGGPVLIGKLELGDSFLESHCRIWQQEKKFSVTYADVTLDTTLCLFQGGGQTLGFEIATLDIIDNNATLSPQYRGQRLTIDVPQAIKNGNLVYGYSHHNDGDRFNLKVPETGAQYELWQSTVLNLEYRLSYPGSNPPVTGSGKGMILMGESPPPPPG